MKNRVIVRRITQQCNLSCNFCSYSREIGRRRDKADALEIERVSEVLVIHGSIFFSKGEDAMIVKWKPQWYELDQSIVVGDVDLFYLSKDTLYFANDFAGDNDCEVKAEILNINHLELGDIKGIITIGLDYSIYLNDGNIIIVNAEESPGNIENYKYAVKEWGFDVEINIIEKTGLSSKERLKMLDSNEKKALQRERIKRYKALLDLTKADWDR